jgi:hypothetical protein
VRYEGSIVGRTVKAFCTRSKEGEPASSILSPKDNATPVLMILSDLSDEIRVYEKDSKKDNKFYTLTRIG